MAKDFFSDAVKNALRKDGWRITNDPLSLEYGNAAFEIDLGAERILGLNEQANELL
jgi:hypothetical protein